MTIAVQVDEFPHSSVTVSVTIFGPSSSQASESGNIDNVTGPPQLSVEPLLIISAVKWITPVSGSIISVMEISCVAQTGGV